MSFYRRTPNRNVIRQGYQRGNIRGDYPVLSETRSGALYAGNIPYNLDPAPREWRETDRGWCNIITGVCLSIGTIAAAASAAGLIGGRRRTRSKRRTNRKHTRRTRHKN
jgi:hypothetical protein